jgi:hypothetical protein
VNDADYGFVIVGKNGAIGKGQLVFGKTPEEARAKAVLADPTLESNKYMKAFLNEAMKQDWRRPVGGENIRQAAGVPDDALRSIGDSEMNYMVHYGRKGDLGRKWIEDFSGFRAGSAAFVTGAGVKVLHDRQTNADPGKPSAAQIRNQLDQ